MCDPSVELDDPCNPVVDTCWVPVSAPVPQDAEPWVFVTGTLDELVEHRAFCSAANGTVKYTPNDPIPEPEDLEDPIGRWYSYMVYTPPAYEDFDGVPDSNGVEDEVQIEFPVVYSLHGTNGWGPSGGPNQIAPRLEKRIREHRADPAVHVFPFGSCKLLAGKPSYCHEGDWMDMWVDRCNPNPPPGEDECVRPEAALWELFAHIDANYSVTDQSEGLGVAGFSAGGGKAMHIGFRDPLADWFNEAGELLDNKDFPFHIFVDGGSSHPFFERPYPFGSVVALSPGFSDQSSEEPPPNIFCWDETGNGGYDPDCLDESGNTVPYAFPRLEGYMNEFAQDPGDPSVRGPVRLLVKHGAVDKTANAFCIDRINNGLDMNGNPIPDGKDWDFVADGVEQLGLELGGLWAYPSEEVTPECGEEAMWEDRCIVELEQPCILEHEASRMQTLRGDEILAFHEEEYWKLPGLESYNLPACALPDGTVDASYAGPTDEYLVGDWSGDGCDTIAFLSGTQLFFDTSVDGVARGFPRDVADLEEPFDRVATVRADGSGRTILLGIDYDDAVACGGTGFVRVRGYDPFREDPDPTDGIVIDERDPVTDDCLEMALDDIDGVDQIMAGDVATIEGLLDPTALDLGDNREDLLFRPNITGCVKEIPPNPDTDCPPNQDNQVTWFTQVAWGFSTESGDTTIGLGVDDDVFSAGYWPSLQITDSFSVDDNTDLNGTDVESGAFTWIADPEAVIRAMNGGGPQKVTATDGTGLSGSASAQGGFPFSVEAESPPVFVEARIFPTTSDWTAIGFANAADEDYVTAGQLWVRVYSAGEFEVLVAGDPVPIASAVVGASGSYDVKLRLDPDPDPTLARWSVLIDGELDPALTDQALPLSFTSEAITHAGFHIENTTNNQAKIDNFVASQGRLNRAGLGIRRDMGGIGPENDLYLNYDQDGSHNLLYSFGTDGDIYLYGDWDGDGQTNVAVVRGAEVFLDAPASDFGSVGTLGFMHEHRYDLPTP